MEAVEPVSLRRYTRLRSGASLKASNPIRRSAKFERNFGSHGAFIRSQPCVVLSDGRPDRRSPCNGRMVAAHTVARGMGGCNGDKRDLVSACWHHHLQMDSEPLPDGGVGLQAFADFFKIEDIHAVAARLWDANPENRDA